MTGWARRWTKEEDTRLLAAVDAGNSHAAIGVMLGRSEKAISLRLWNLRKASREPAVPVQEELFSKPSAPTPATAKRHRKQWSRKDRRILFEMRAAKASPDEIARVLGRTRRSVNSAATDFKTVRMRRPRQILPAPPSPAVLTPRHILAKFWPVGVAVAAAAGVIAWIAH